MTLQTHEILNKITTSMKQLANIYANEQQHMCNTPLDNVYFAGKEKAFREALTEIQRIIAKYEAKEGESWKNSTNK